MVLSGTLQQTTASVKYLNLRSIDDVTNTVAIYTTINTVTASKPIVLVLYILNRHVVVILTVIVNENFGGDGISGSWSVGIDVFNPFLVNNTQVIWLAIYSVCFLYCCS